MAGDTTQPNGIMTDTQPGDTIQLQGGTAPNVVTETDGGTQRVQNSSGDTAQVAQPISTVQASVGTPISPGPQTQQDQVSSDPFQQQPLQKGPTQSPEPAKPPTPPGIPQDDPYKYHPLVQHAGVQNSVARALAGGDRYTTRVDPNTGVTTRERIPMSKGDIGLAIALSALSGGLAGLGAKGPANLGQAAGLGLQQGQKIAQQNRDNQDKVDQNAKDDAQLQQQAVANGLHMYSLGLSLGKQDEDAHQSSVAANADEYKQAQDDGNVIADNLNEKDAMDTKTYPLDKDHERLIVGYHPRIGQDGKPVYTTFGGTIVPEGTPGGHVAYDNTYAIVKNQPVDLVDDKGSKLPWVQEAIKRGDITLDKEGNFSQGFQMNSTRARAIKQQNAAIDNSENDINRVRQGEGMEPLQLDDAIKSNRSYGKTLNSFTGLLNATGGDYDKAIDALRKTDSSGANWLQTQYGGKDVLHKISMVEARHRVEADYSINGMNDKQAEQESQNPNASPWVRQLATQQLDAKTSRDVKVHEGEAAYSSSLAESRESDAQHLKKTIEDSELGDPDLAIAPPDADGVRHAYLNSLPKTSQPGVTAIGEGRDGLASKATKTGDTLRKQVNNAYPNYMGSKFMLNQAAMKDATSGRGSIVATSLNTTLHHMGAMYDNATRLATTPGANMLTGIFGSGESRQQVKNYQFSQASLEEEFPKLLKAGVITQPEADKWHKEFSAYSPNEARANLKAVIPLIAGRIDALQYNLDNASPTGHSTMNLMSGESQRVLERIGGRALLQQEDKDHPGLGLYKRSSTVPGYKPRIDEDDVSGEVPLSRQNERRAGQGQSQQSGQNANQVGQTQNSNGTNNASYKPGAVNPSAVLPKPDPKFAAAVSMKDGTSWQNQNGNWVKVAH